MKVSYFAISEHGFVVLGTSIEKMKDMVKAELSLKSSEMTLATYMKFQEDIERAEYFEDIQIISYLIENQNGININFE